MELPQMLRVPDLPRFHREETDATRLRRAFASQALKRAAQINEASFLAQFYQAVNTSKEQLTRRSRELERSGFQHLCSGALGMLSAAVLYLLVSRNAPVPVTPVDLVVIYTPSGIFGSLSAFFLACYAKTQRDIRICYNRIAALDKTTIMLLGASTIQDHAMKVAAVQTLAQQATGQDSVDDETEVNQLMRMLARATRLNRVPRDSGEPK